MIHSIICPNDYLEIVNSHKFRLFNHRVAQYSYCYFDTVIINGI
jgi:hypothetical protein